MVNSIGVISHARQTLLIAVLSGNQPSESEGIRQVQAAAIAAAAAITARVQQGRPGDVALSGSASVNGH